MPRIYAESGGMEGGISVERLTERYGDGTAYYDIVPGKSVIDRLADIEDILGGDYDLDRLRELVEADRDGRCVVIPDFVWKVGETKGVIKVPYKTWMGRFIGTKFFKTEKEAAEAALKGEQNVD